MPKMRTPSGETVFATAAGAEALLAHGYTYANGPAPEAADPSTTLTLAERIEAVAGHAQANALAAELGVEGFKEKTPNVAAKQQALRDAAAAKTANEPPADGLDDLSDEDLAAKIAELYPDEDSEKIAAAIAADRAAVIAGLRQS